MLHIVRHLSRYISRAHASALPAEHYLRDLKVKHTPIWSRFISYCSPTPTPCLYLPPRFGDLVITPPQALISNSLYIPPWHFSESVVPKWFKILQWNSLPAYRLHIPLHPLALSMLASLFYQLQQIHLRQSRWKNASQCELHALIYILDLYILSLHRYRTSKNLKEVTSRSAGKWRKYANYQK